MTNLEWLAFLAADKSIWDKLTKTKEQLTDSEKEKLRRMVGHYEFANKELQAILEDKATEEPKEETQEEKPETPEETETTVEETEETPEETTIEETETPAEQTEEKSEEESSPIEFE